MIPLRPVPSAQLGVVEGKSKPGRAAHDVEGDITRNGCCAYPKLAPVLSALSLDQCTEGNFEVLHPEPAHKYLGFSAAELFPLREALRDFSRKSLDFTPSYTAILKLSLYMPSRALHPKSLPLKIFRISPYSSRILVSTRLQPHCFHRAGGRGVLPQGYTSEASQRQRTGMGS